MSLEELVIDFIKEEFKPRRIKIGKNFKYAVRVNNINYHISAKDVYIPKIKEIVYLTFGFHPFNIDHLISSNIS